MSPVATATSILQDEEVGEKEQKIKKTALGTPFPAPKYCIFELLQCEANLKSEMQYFKQTFLFKINQRESMNLISPV